jgi:hypothetical protein
MEIMARFDKDARRADIMKTSLGDNLSEIFRKANKIVPAINPSCTEDSKAPAAPSVSSYDSERSLIMAFPANQTDVPKNCDTTIAGRITFDLIPKHTIINIIFRDHDPDNYCND